MKIKRKPENIKIPFKSIKSGAAFLYNEELYIKVLTASSQYRVNVVKLQNGYAGHFPPDVGVEEINVEIVEV